jgi:hypothetical protein
VTKYNGWANWQTWNAYNWITSYEGEYRIAFNIAKRAANEDGAAAALREWYEGFMPTLPPSWWSDALQDAFDRIDFHEVAAALRE